MPSAIFRFVLCNIIVYCLVSCGGGTGATKPASSASAISISASSKSIAASASSLSSSASSIAPAVQVNDAIYGLYVSLGIGRANPLLGNATQEAAFLKFVRDNGFNYLIFYDLEGLNSASREAGQLASLIQRAKSQFGVQQIGAALGSANEADTVVTYNNAHENISRIDVLNLEYEFWNKKNRTEEFNTAINTLNYFKTVAANSNLKTEIYIGWVSDQEAKQLGEVVDRILVHYYVTTDRDIINYGLDRLQSLAGASRKVRIAPIFSNEGPTNTADLPFMGTWLETHPNEQAFKSWISGYMGLQKSWQANLDVVGSVWFVYRHFADINLNSYSHINQQPENQVVCAGGTSRFNVTSNATTKVYYWMKDGKNIVDSEHVSGANTATLTISNASVDDVGSYYVRVVSYDSNNPISVASESATLTLSGSCLPTN